MRVIEQMALYQMARQTRQSLRHGKVPTLNQMMSMLLLLLLQQLLVEKKIPLRHAFAMRLMHF
jgi:hypothetical protein